MAKKDKDTLYAEYLAELVALKPELKDLLSDQQVSAKLREGVLARADYSSSMDELKVARKQMEDYLAQEKTKIEGWQKWYGDTSQTFATTAEQLQKYKDEFGDLDDAGQRREAKKLGMSPEEVQAALTAEIAKQQSAFIKFADDLTDIKMEHRDKFKEGLNTDAVYDVAAKEGVSLKQAYKIHIADRVEELQKKNMEDQLKSAREEGFKEALTKHNLPIVPSDSPLTHILDVKDAPRTSDDRIAAAVASWGKK